MKKISNTKFYFLNLLFLITPFIQFFQTNSVEVAFYLSDIIKIFVLVFFLYLLIFLLIKKKEIITAFSFLYFSLFQFAIFNLVFNQTISLIIIITFFLIFTKYLINNNLIINFFVIFLSINTMFFLMNLI